MTFIEKIVYAVIRFLTWLFKKEEKVKPPDIVDRFEDFQTVSESKEANHVYVNKKGFDEFANALGQRESGNRYDIKNSWGYLGRWQFGKPRLYDLGYSIDGWHPPNQQRKLSVTEEEFLKNKHMQNEVFNRHVKDLSTRLHNLFWAEIGMDKYGVFITLSGLVAGAHIGGFGGVREFMRNGSNPSDQLGTSIKDYIDLFKGYDLNDMINNERDMIV
jgi:hypothetical protein